MRSRSENPAAFWLLLCGIGAVVGLMACAIASRNEDDDGEDASTPARRDATPPPVKPETPPPAKPATEPSA
jgi:hypothetical protein